MKNLLQRILKEVHKDAPLQPIFLCLNTCIIIYVADSSIFNVFIRLILKVFCASAQISFVWNVNTSCKKNLMEHKITGFPSS
jgi:hypothetical protein